MHINIISYDINIMWWVLQALGFWSSKFQALATPIKLWNINPRLECFLKMRYITATYPQGGDAGMSGFLWEKDHL